MYISKYKELSFGEKNLLQMTEDLLVQEIQIVCQKDKQSIVNDLKEPFRTYFAPGIEHAHEQAATPII